VKVGLLELARQLGNVSQACKMMGFRNGPFGVKPPSDDLATVIVLPFVVDAGRHIMPSDRSQ
jgi:sirohydrochlorin ferrochelatase